MREFLLLLSILPFSVFSQNVLNVPVDSVTGLITYKKIITINGKSKDELFVSAKKWAYDFYKNPKAVFNVEDKDAGIIILNTSYKEIDSINNSVLQESISYTLKIETKEGKLKVSVYEFIASTVPGKPPLENSLIFSANSEGYKNLDFRKKLKNNLESHVSSIFKSLEKQLLNNDDF
jgi:Domain of unknown function (DUF4468) with TBP-like fold